LSLNNHGNLACRVRLVDHAGICLAEAHGREIVPLAVKSVAGLGFIAIKMHLLLLYTLSLI
jgi:hypothetical protein